MPLVCQTGLTSVQRVREEDKEGVAAESATIKRKVSVLAVRLVSTEGACETCKKAGVAAECTYGTGAAWCKGSMGRGSPLKQQGARWRRRSSSR